MPPPTLYDLKSLDFNKPLYRIEEIRKVNPQRDQMEQLTAIVHIDRDKHGVVGYKDITEDEFWVTGHMPGFPLMPGVIMCECVAQLAGFYARKFDLLGGDFLGFGGMDEVRFRSPIFPNSRLILMVQITKLRPKRRAVFQFQGLVGERMAFSGSMIGVPINRDQKLDGEDND